MSSVSKTPTLDYSKWNHIASDSEGSDAETTPQPRTITPADWKACETFEKMLLDFQETERQPQDRALFAKKCLKAGAAAGIPPHKIFTPTYLEFLQKVESALGMSIEEAHAMTKAPPTKTNVPRNPGEIGPPRTPWNDPKVQQRLREFTRCPGSVPPFDYKRFEKLKLTETEEAIDDSSTSNFRFQAILRRSPDDQGELVVVKAVSEVDTEGRALCEIYKHTGEFLATYPFNTNSFKTSGSAPPEIMLAYKGIQIPYPQDSQSEQGGIMVDFKDESTMTQPIERVSARAEPEN